MVFLTYVYHDARFGKCKVWNLITLRLAKTTCHCQYTALRNLGVALMEIQLRRDVTGRRLVKAPYTLSVKLSDFTVWCHIWRKNWITAQFWQAIAQASELSFPVVCHTQNCAVHSGNPTVSSVYLPTPRWHRIKVHTSISSNSFSRWTSHDIFLFKYHFLLHILHFLFFFSDNIMDDVASK